jgi:hypothetical protein
MKFSKILLLGSVFGIGWLSAALVPPTAMLPTASPEAVVTAEVVNEPRAVDRMAQQDFGSRCSTAQGICSLSRPKPIGSVCYCGSERGTTIR